MPVWLVMSDPPDVSRETSFFSRVGFSRDAQSTSPGSVSHSGRFHKIVTWPADREGPSASWGRLEDSGTAPDRTRVNCKSVGPRRSSHVAERRRGPSGSSSVFHVEHDASLQLGVSGERDRSSKCVRGVSRETFCGSRDHTDVPPTISVTPGQAMRSTAPAVGVSRLAGAGRADLRCRVKRTRPEARGGCP